MSHLVYFKVKASARGRASSLSRPLVVLAAIFLVWLTLGQAARAQNLVFTPVATGLEEPWAIGFLPGGDILVTERGGRLLRFPAGGGAAVAVGGVPRVATIGQGGLLDVMVPRDFATTRRVWLSYAAPVAGGAGTSAGFGRISAPRRVTFLRGLFREIR